MNLLVLACLMLASALLLWYSERQRRRPLKKVRKQRTFRVIDGGKKL